MCSLFKEAFNLRVFSILSKSLLRIFVLNSAQDVSNSSSLALMNSSIVDHLLLKRSFNVALALSGPFKCRFHSIFQKACLKSGTVCVFITSAFVIVSDKSKLSSSVNVAL